MNALWLVAIVAILDVTLYDRTIPDAQRLPHKSRVLRPDRGRAMEESPSKGYCSAASGGCHHQAPRPHRYWLQHVQFCLYHWSQGNIVNIHNTSLLLWPKQVGQCICNCTCSLLSDANTRRTLLSHSHCCGFSGWDGKPLTT